MCAWVWCDAVANVIGGCIKASRYWGVQLAVQHVPRWVVWVVLEGFSLVGRASRLPLERFPPVGWRAAHRPYGGRLPKEGLSRLFFFCFFKPHFLIEPPVNEHTVSKLDSWAMPRARKKRVHGKKGLREDKEIWLRRMGMYDNMCVCVCLKLTRSNELFNSKQPFLLCTSHTVWCTGSSFSISVLYFTFSG